MAEDIALDIAVKRLKKVSCHKCGFSVEVADAEPLSIVRCRACRTLLRVPAKLGDYLLTERLGTGSAGSTYVARDVNLHRDVAVKVIRKSLQGDDDVADSVMREARVLAALNHPNVVHIFTVATHDDQPFIVMELVRGEPISSLVKAKGPMSERRTLAMAVNVAEGLRASMDIGLIHGDIKPGNILIEEQGEAKVVDFGLARTAVPTEEDKVRGTPNYIAPEKAAAKKADHRADIYSLGCTMYFALTGKRPFEGRTMREVFAARLREPTPDARAQRRDLTGKTAELIARMMDREPDARPATYAELLFELRAAQQELDKRPSKSSTPQKRRSQERAKRPDIKFPSAPPPPTVPQMEAAVESQRGLHFGDAPAGQAPPRPEPATPQRSRVRVRRRGVDATAIAIIAGIILAGIVVFFISLRATGLLG